MRGCREELGQCTISRSRMSKRIIRKEMRLSKTRAATRRAGYMTSLKSILLSAV